MDTRKINVLWTGGLDSTYLIVLLALKKNISIQPYYIIDEERKSTPKELNAITSITKRIRCNSKFYANLQDVIVVKKKDISDDDTISNSWKRLHEKYQLGSQYDFLARFAKQYNLQLAVGVLFSDRGKVARTISGQAILRDLELFGCSFLTVYNESRTDTIEVFENILFPKFMKDKEKVEEWKELIDMGVGEIARFTWFCHSPVMGLPCGHCNPCKDALNEGMQFRVPLVGRILGFLEEVCSWVLNIPRRIIK